MQRAEARAWVAKVGWLEELVVAAAGEAATFGVERFAVLEAASILRIGQGAASGQLADADRWTQCLPATLRALDDGTMFLPAARALFDVTRNCSVPVCQEVERRILALMPSPGPQSGAGAGWSSVDVRAKARRLVLTVASELEPEALRAAEATAKAGRRVWARAEEDAMTFLGALLPAEKARAFCEGLDRLAYQARRADRAAQKAGGPCARTLDQCRADVLADLPLHALATCGHPSGHPSGHPGTHPGCEGGPGGVQVIVNLHLPMSTALGLDNTPGHLDGHGPLSAWQIRDLLPHATLRRIAVDARTGTPIAVDDTLRPPPRTRKTQPGSSRTGSSRTGTQGARTAGRTRPRTAQELRDALLDLIGPWTVTDRPEPQHDPSVSLARLVDLRDRRCTGPGCTVPAGRTDRDHLIAWPTGPTAAWNLKATSRRCHRAKHTGWTLTVHPDNSTTWTSPTGITCWRPSPHDRPPPLPDPPEPGTRLALPPLTRHDPRPTPAEYLRAPDGPLLDEPLLDPPTRAPRHTPAPRPGPTTRSTLLADEPCPF